jgi:hypothetical protein
MFGEETGMRGLANKLGLRYAGHAGDGGYEADMDGLPDLALFSKVEPSEFDDIMYGRLNGTNVQLMNVNLGGYEDEPRFPRRSVCIISFVATFPRLMLSPHTRMTKLRQASEWKRLRSVSKEFKETFNIETSDDEFAEFILDDNLVGWMLGQPITARLHLEGGDLLGHIPQTDEQGYPEFVEYVQGFHGRIRQDAWTKYSLFGSL